MRKPLLPVTPTNETTGIIDAHAGAQLRAARLAVKWSQRKLGEAAGVSFQQVQKYERGTNRIAFSTLQKFAAAMNLPIEHFLHDGPATAGGLETSQPRAEYLASSHADAAELLKLFEGFASEDQRAQLLQIARLLNDKNPKPDRKNKQS